MSLPTTRPKPLDKKLILELCLNHEVLITIEEGSIGGFGSHVFHMLSERGIFDKGLKIRSMILPDQFIEQDTPENMYKLAGLDAKSIEQNSSTLNIKKCYQKLLKTRPTAVNLKWALDTIKKKLLKTVFR